MNKRDLIFTFLGTIFFLSVTSGFAKENDTTKSGFGGDIGFGGPTSVGEQLQEDDLKKKSAVRFSGFDAFFNPWFKTKRDLNKKYGLQLAFDYNFLYQNAGVTLPGNEDQTASGAIRFFGNWNLIGRGTANKGSLVFKVENRHRISTDIPPSQLGFDIGYSGMTGTLFSDAGSLLGDLNWQQLFNGGRGGLIFGRYDPNDYVDVSGHANPWTTFQNLAVTSNTTIALPDWSYGVGAGNWIASDVGEWFVLGSISDANGTTDDLSFFDGGSEFFTAIELGWSPDRSQRYTNHLHITGWHVDTHGALALLRAKEMLMNGYTTVRDMGGPANYLKKIIDEGLTPGPRIYPSENWITTSSGHGDFRDLNDPNDGLSHFYSEYVQTVADGPDETTKAVRNAFRRGAVQIKLFTSGGVTSTYDPLHSGPNADEIQAAVKVAEAWDTYVATHSFNERAIKLAIDNGVKSIEHAPFLTDEIAKVMIEKGIYLATGIAPVLEITVEQARSQYSTASFNKWLPVREAATELLKVLKRNPELKVVLGSDLLGPWNNMVATDDKMNLEFKYFAEAIGNYRALKMATSLAGEMNLMSGKMNPYPDSQLGIIEEGAYADLLLVDGNPLENIELMTAPDKNFKIIMKDGTIYKNSL